MTRTIVAVYESLYAANQAVHELLEIGFSQDLIDIMLCQRGQPADSPLIPVTGAGDESAEDRDQEPAGSDHAILSAAAAEARLMNKVNSKRDLRSEINYNGQSLGMWIGLGVGSAMGLTGALFNALGALHLTLSIPALLQFNPSMIGWLNAILISGAGAALGVISGGAIGGMLGLNISEEEARQYAKNAREGDVVITILADWDSIDPAMQIVQKHNPLEVREHTVSKEITGYLIAASQPIFFPRRINSRDDDQERR